MNDINAGFPHPGGPLQGSLVRIEPLALDHLAGLREATDDGRIWDHWYTSVPTPDAMEAEIRHRLDLRERGEMMPFAAIRQSDDAVLGMTSFASIDPAVPRLEVGYTWNRASTHGTGTNAESKLLLMTYAFELWRAECVLLKTSWANTQSRAAIERLGAKSDGVLRAARRARNGVLEDVANYSILKHEWPAVKAKLVWRLRDR